MTIIDDLAERARAYLTGLPWNEVAGNPAEDVIGPRHYLVPLRDIAERVSVLGEKVNFTWDVQTPDAILAWKGVQESIISQSTLIDAAIKANVAEFTGKTVELDREVFRAFVSKMFETVTRGWLIHKGNVLKGVPADKVVNNADLVYATGLALLKLDAWGALKPFYKQHQVNGLPVVALGAIIGVAMVAIVIVLGWFISRQTIIYAQWQLANEACRAATENPTPANVEACQKAQAALGEGKDLGSFGGFGSIAMLVAGGVLLWAASPYLLKR
jgi:hypothetical protein